MKFTNALDELEHWMGLLQLELHRGAERRYIVAIGRLCEVTAQKVARDKSAPREQLERRLTLTHRWAGLQKQMAAPPPAPVQPNPPARRVGRWRVIQGGRALSGTTRR